MAKINSEELSRELKKQTSKGLYLFHGEEPYFIDLYSRLMAERLIPQGEQDFELEILYGLEVSMDQLRGSISQYPMVGDRRLVILREAQELKGLLEDRGGETSSLLSYLGEETTFVICYKGKIPEGKPLYKLADGKGKIYLSSSISERDLPSFIISELQREGLAIDPMAASLISQHVGNDLERLGQELEKLSIALKGRGGRISLDDVEQLVGISRQYNDFELLEALRRRDAPKALEIIYAFSHNDKAYPLQRTVATLFGFFSRLLFLYYPPFTQQAALTPQRVAEVLGLRSFQATQYLEARGRYTAFQVFEIIRLLRMIDAGSKGVDSNSSDEELRKELIVGILSA